MVIKDQPVLVNLEQQVFDAIRGAAGRAVTFEELAMRIYGFEDKGTRNCLRIHVYRIRQKLGAHAVISVSRVGYRYGLFAPRHGIWRAAPANDGPDVDAGAWQVFRAYRNDDDSREDEFFGEFFSKKNAELVAQHLNQINYVPVWGEVQP